MDSTHAANTKRIAKNTLFLYGRMLFGMLVSLYTSRLVLNALGVDDFGIYGVVGGLVAMFSLISGSLQASISRFITFELGTNNMERLKRTFSTAFVIQAILAGIIFVLGETLGLWFLNTKMVIPPDRLFAANVVFQASIFSFMLGLLLMPYYACITAHEKMDAYAYMGLLDIFLKLGIVLFIAFSPLPFDRMIAYSLLLFASGIIMQAIAVTYCRKRFEESKVRWHLDKEYLKSMSGFAGWNFIGASSAVLRDSGVNVLLNLFFGPVVNAARSISGSVSAAVGSFTGNFMTAVNPQITKSLAAEDHSYLMSLIYKSSKFGLFVMFLLALPILFRTQYILEIWLKIVPEHAVNFVRLVLIFSILEVISSPLVTAQLATGKIRNYQIVVGGLQMLNFPLSYLALYLGAAPESVLVVAIVLSVCCLIARLFFLRGMIGLSVRKFLSQVIVRDIAVVALSVVPVIFLNYLLPDNLLGLIGFCLPCMIITAFIIYFAGCNGMERSFLMDNFLKFKKKIRLNVCR